LEEAILRHLSGATVRRLGQFLFATGLRLGEVLGMQEDQWHAKDGAGHFEVTHALKREGGTMVRVEGGKTPSATRTFPVGPDLAALIEAQCVENEALDRDSAFLFPTGAGTPWNPSNFRDRHWYPAVYTAYVKSMTAKWQHRWLGAVPTELRTAARLLLLDDTITVPAVLDARWSDLHGSSLTYICAGGQKRAVEIPPDLMSQLTAEWKLSDAARIVAGKRGQRFSLPRFVRLVFKEPFQANGEDVDRRIHRARHTFASNWRSDNPTLTQEVLQEILGHGYASSTERYLHPLEADLARPADTLSNRRRRAAEGDPTAMMREAVAGADIDVEQLVRGLLSHRDAHRIRAALA
jgi:integrase